MSTALLSVNIINKAINIFLIAIIVLKGNFHHNIILGAIKINRLWIQNFLLLVEMLDKRTNTSIVMESFIFAAALIMKMDIISEKYNVKFVLSVSRNEADLPECAKAKIIVSL